MITEKEYRYWLCNIPGLSARKIAELLHYFGSAEAIWKSDELSLMRAMEQASEGSCRFKENDLVKICNGVASLDSAVKEYHKLEERGIRFITPQDSVYPERLRNLYDMPQGLYMTGELPRADRPAVAIVGARNCSHYGEEMAFILARELCSRGVDIISGMALGIDGAAHRGAMAVTNRKQTEDFVPLLGEENSAHLGEREKRKAAVDESCFDPGNTYAVLGCGVDVCYPRTNKDVFGQLRGTCRNRYRQQATRKSGTDQQFPLSSDRKNFDGDHLGTDQTIRRPGGLISEFPPGTQPTAFHFPLRNRIISGLADMVIVVEARYRSGSLITADQALEQGRDVYAIPGRVTDPLSRGCNELIKQGAGIITDPVDFAEKNFSKQVTCASKRKKNKIALALSEEKVYSCLDFSPTHLSAITSLTGFSTQDTVSILMQLMMKELIVETSKNYYALKFR